MRMIRQSQRPQQRRVHRPSRLCCLTTLCPPLAHSRSRKHAVATLLGVMSVSRALELASLQVPILLTCAFAKSLHSLVCRRAALQKAVYADTKAPRRYSVDACDGKSPRMRATTPPTSYGPQSLPLPPAFIRAMNNSTATYLPPSPDDVRVMTLLATTCVLCRSSRGSRLCRRHSGRPKTCWHACSSRSRSVGTLQQTSQQPIGAWHVCTTQTKGTQTPPQRFQASPRRTPDCWQQAPSEMSFNITNNEQHSRRARHSRVNHRGC